MGIYPSHRTSGDDTTKALGLARDAGIKWTRDELGWQGLQPAPNTWNWERLDHAIDTTREHGVEIMGLLAYCAPWAASRTTPAGEPDVMSTPDLSAWREYVSAAVERYRDRIRVWQMWNEPNISQFWHPEPNPAEYARLLIAGSEAAKAVDPDCWIVGLNTSRFEAPFARAVFDEGGWEHTDIVGVHPYRYPHTPEATDLVGELRELAGLCASYGEVKPVWLTELGYPTHHGPRASTEWWSAIMLMRTYLSAWSSGLAQKLFWYCFQDGGGEAEYNEHNFGIVRRDWSTKMPYDGYRVMATTLDGFVPDGRIDLGDEIRAYRFRGSPNGSEEVRIAAWRTSEITRKPSVAVPIPVATPQVRVVKPWRETGGGWVLTEADITMDADTDVLDAKNGWVMAHLDATPAFFVVA